MEEKERVVNTAAPTEGQAELRGELKLLVFLFVFGAALFYEALAVNGIFQGISSGPGSLPQLVSALLLALICFEGLALVRRGYREGSLKEMLAFLFDREVMTLLVMVAAYGMFIERLGFVVTSTVFLFVTMYLLDRKQPVEKLLIAVGAVAVLYLIFSTIFQVVLP